MYVYLEIQLFFRSRTLSKRSILFPWNVFGNGLILHGIQYDPYIFILPVPIVWLTFALRNSLATYLTTILTCITEITTKLDSCTPNARYYLYFLGILDRLGGRVFVCAFRRRRPFYLRHYLSSFLSLPVFNT